MLAVTESPLPASSTLSLKRSAQNLGLGRPGPRQQGGELIAAPAGDEVTLAQAVGDGSGEQREDSVSSLMPLGIVHRLESIQVQHQHR
jgi:hypothetical protein